MGRTSPEGDSGELPPRVSLRSLALSYLHGSCPATDKHPRALTFDLQPSRLWGVTLGARFSTASDSHPGFHEIHPDKREPKRQASSGWCTCTETL